MAKLSDFCKLTEEYAGLADFAVIYVEEAHPTDGWKFQVMNLFHVSSMFRSKT